jgi:hypothetical protein
MPKKERFDTEFILNISNVTNNTENISVLIINNIDGEIFNKTFMAESKEMIMLTPIEEIKGTYVINAYVDENRTIINESILVLDYSTVFIMIYDNFLHIRTGLT